METPPKAKLSISVKHLGPIFHLRDELGKDDQNLIFAKNGTGKSFLSRALRYLDHHGQGASTSGATHELVSEESETGTGSFSIARGEKEMGSIKLNQEAEEPKIMLNDKIFHVFTEDFVQEELRERKFNIDSELENRIFVVGREEVEIDKAQVELYCTHF